MENVENILERLYSFYKVAGASELSEKINTTQQTISNWKKRNSISAIKKKCRELGIYREIFKDEIKQAEDLILKVLKKEEEDERKNSIDEDTMFHIQNLFIIAKKKNLLKELKTELSMMYLKYSTYDKDSKTESGENIFNDKIVFEVKKEKEANE
ncbi:helix-turn-helix domain-containing protein [Aliarcobacter butzleri]|uniref:Helix-turn-helix domain-containing protein n=1 Tax=Aliarcobacter butzleri TaxID=28197 RepID=A0AAW7Q8Y3_9BACT|nr:helix-turn-helix domain-containing protein [Aliarcobacter butzleri]MDN5107565.1 helix-turn-helix domain-containing protein [Aliarcobacter butzleri]MDN5122889.1 helix-turn-helix domain-containing protein [Aliarcobacter butzleri]